MTMPFELMLANVLNFLPQLLAGVLVMLVGLWLAKLVRRGVIKTAGMLSQSNILQKTPLEQSIKNLSLEQHIDEFVGSLVYWLMVILSVYVAANVWGLTAVALLIGKIFGYTPRLLSALVVLVLGALLAGVVESLVKNSLRQADLGSAMAAGKIASYAVMIMAVLISLSELGIARDFILIAFVGLVMALSLAFGLAMGLGAQASVAKTIDQWLKSSKPKSRK